MEEWFFSLRQEFGIVLRTGIRISSTRPTFSSETELIKVATLSQYKLAKKKQLSKNPQSSRLKNQHLNWYFSPNLSLAHAYNTHTCTNYHDNHFHFGHNVTSLTWARNNLIQLGSKTYLVQANAVINWRNVNGNWLVLTSAKSWSASHSNGKQYTIPSFPSNIHGQ